jgi:hypothetical protein
MLVSKGQREHALDLTGNTFFTTPVQTSAGATLDGIIQLATTSGSTFTYNSAFTNIGGTSLTVVGVPEQLTWVSVSTASASGRWRHLGESGCAMESSFLEIFSVKSCS